MDTSNQLTKLPNLWEKCYSLPALFFPFILTINILFEVSFDVIEGMDDTGEVLLSSVRINVSAFLQCVGFYLGSLDFQENVPYV